MGLIRICSFFRGPRSGGAWRSKSRILRLLENRTRTPAELRSAFPGWVYSPSNPRRNRRRFLYILSSILVYGYTCSLAHCARSPCSLPHFPPLPVGAVSSSSKRWSRECLKRDQEFGPCGPCVVIGARVAFRHFRSSPGATSRASGPIVAVSQSNCEAVAEVDRQVSDPVEAVLRKSHQVAAFASLVFPFPFVYPEGAPARGTP